MCLLKLVSTILCLIVAGSNTVSVQVNYSKFLLNKKNFITFHPVLFFRFCGYRSPPSVLVRSYILNSGFQPQPLIPTFRAYFKRNHLLNIDYFLSWSGGLRRKSVWVSLIFVASALPTKRNYECNIDTYLALTFVV